MALPHSPVQFHFQRTLTCVHLLILILLFDAVAFQFRLGPEWQTGFLVWQLVGYNSTTSHNSRLFNDLLRYALAFVIDIILNEFDQNQWVSLSQVHCLGLKECLIAD